MSTGIVGTFIAFVGFIIAFIMVGADGGGHFSGLHPVLGFASTALLFSTPVIGSIARNMKEKGRHLRTRHKQVGHSVLVIMLVTIVLGFKVAGVF